MNSATADVPIPGGNMTDQFGGDARAAKAEAKAAKARAKAMRPWYKKKRYILSLSLVGLMVIVGVAGGGEEDTVAAGAGGGAPDTPAAEGTKVTTKLSTNEVNPPAADVTLANCYRDELGHMQADVAIVNKSSKRSSYFIDVTFKSGNEQLDTSNVIVNNLDPGATATEEAITFEEHTGAFTCEVTDVERMAS